MEKLLRHLIFLANECAGFGKRYIAKVFLLELGVPTEENSFEYLVDAILVYVDKGNCSITKIIYPEVAHLHNTAPSAVGKAIERVIHNAWSRKSQKWNMYFLYEECPTNTEFISRIAKILEICTVCCKSVLKKEVVQ